MPETIEFETVLKADEPTVNGRVYPRAVLETALAAYNKRDSRLGTFDTDWLLKGLKLADVSHQIIEAKLNDEGRVVVKVEVLKTKRGEALQAALDAKKVGIVLACTPVGMGTVENDVVKEFVLEAINFYPEFPRCPTCGFMSSRARGCPDCGDGPEDTPACPFCGNADPTKLRPDGGCDACGEYPR